MNTRIKSNVKLPLMVMTGVVGMSWFWWKSKSSTIPTGTLLPNTFCLLPITHIEPLNDNTSLYTFKLDKPIIKPNIPIWSIWVKDDTLQAIRRYTPIYISNTSLINELKLAIKLYPNGQVSRFLWRKKIGDQIEIYGPEPTWEYQPYQHQHILLLAGGTGITPMIQLLNYTLNDPKDKTCFTLLYGARSNQDHILVEYLNELQEKYSNRLRIIYLAEEIKPNELGMINWKGKIGRIKLNDIKEVMYWSKKLATLVIVCGPDGMIDTLAGRKLSDTNPGPVTGILAQLGYKDGQVIKL